jgi:hypothetical protein
MESLHGFAGGARADAGRSILNIITTKSLRREMRGRSGRRDGDRAKQKSSGIPALRERNRGGAYERPRGHPASQDSAETPAETPAIGPKGPYCGDSGATVRRRVERDAAGAEQGCQRASDRPGDQTSDRGTKHSQRLWEGRRSRQGVGGQVRQREGVRRADRNLAAQRSAPTIGSTSLERGGARL